MVIIYDGSDENGIYNTIAIDYNDIRDVVLSDDDRFVEELKSHIN